MTATYFTTPTDLGNIKDANAKALGLPRRYTALAIGDGGGDNAPVPTPKPSQKALLGEWRRAALNTLEVDPKNPSQLIAEQVIPENEGGKWIREMGLYDEDGDLCYVCNAPPTYKPLLAEGSGKTQSVRMVVINTTGVNVELKIDPSLILATRDYADKSVTAAMKAHTDAPDPHPQYALKNVTVIARNDVVKDTDLNSLTTAGVYTYAHKDGGNANAPEWAPQYGVMLVLASYGAITQVIHDQATQEISSRTKLGNGNWSAWNRQAVRGTTLDAYGITDAYTKARSDQTFLAKADADRLYFTREQAVTMFAPGQATFEATGDFTPVREDNWVTMIAGGGGGGAGGRDVNGMLIPGGGGGAGQWVYRRYVKLQPGVPVRVTIGAGGKGATTVLAATSVPLASGGTGGASSFGTNITLSGGSGGGGGFTGSGSVGGAGGKGWPYGSSGEYSASTVAQTSRGGAGGSGLFGSGGPGSHGYQPMAANGYGSGGGGGALYYMVGYDSNGGDGSGGVCIVEW
ncbi:hypothetical protein PCO31111_04197 [Pandoraea communis]|uniref:Phage tail protein n=1 Tax=Pandoraea communis TaxID=2508297 RepID=A0A5E4XZ01_9BURK|nr:phage tail protein [Pandoraea communis]VVE41507.1 hypothetical protein PCO31111_04197 [Pandoraea communis]